MSITPCTLPAFHPCKCSSRRKDTEFQTKRVFFRESMLNWYTILLLSAHPKCVFFFYTSFYYSKQIFSIILLLNFCLVNRHHWCQWININLYIHIYIYIYIYIYIWWICPLVKIITTHNFFFLFSQFSNHLTTSNTHCDSYIHETISNLPCSAFIIIHTHILTINYTTTQQHANIIHHPQTHTHKKNYTQF